MLEFRHTNAAALPRGRRFAGAVLVLTLVLSMLVPAGAAGAVAPADESTNRIDSNTTLSDSERLATVEPEPSMGGSIWMDALTQLAPIIVLFVAAWALMKPLGLPRVSPISHHATRGSLAPPPALRPHPRGR